MGRSPSKRKRLAGVRRERALDDTGGALRHGGHVRGHGDAIAAPPALEREDIFVSVCSPSWSGVGSTDSVPVITMEMVDRFLTKMYRTNADFVFTVTPDFVRTCRTPVLILRDDIPAHPYAVAMEAAMLAPNAEVSMFPWKEPKERVPLAVRQSGGRATAATGPAEAGRHVRLICRADCSRDQVIAATATSRDSVSTSDRDPDRRTLARAGRG